MMINEGDRVKVVKLLRHRFPSVELGAKGTVQYDTGTGFFVVLDGATEPEYFSPLEVKPVVRLPVPA